jgi:tetraacyldisaccharide 4'-kinase
MSLRQRLQASWNSRGPLTMAMLPLSLLFRLVLALRRLCASAGLLPVEHLPVPVVVVGNLIAGGAGKTPAVMAVVALLRQTGWTPGIV